MDAKIRKLKSEDNQVFEVEVESLKLSKFLMDLINDFPDDEDEITINQVDGKNLKLIVDYLNQYKNKKIKEIPKPLPSGDLKLYLDEWDYNYINPLSLEESIDLLNAAQSLDINELINLISAKIASEMLIGTVDEVVEIFLDSAHKYTYFPLFSQEKFIKISLPLLTSISACDILKSRYIERRYIGRRGR